MLMLSSDLLTEETKTIPPHWVSSCPCGPSTGLLGVFSRSAASIMESLLYPAPRSSVETWQTKVPRGTWGQAVVMV